MGGYVGAGVETEASLVATWACGVDVAILSVVETLGAAVGGVVECEGLRARCSEGSVRAVVELAVEMVFNLLGSCLEKVISVGGAGVDPMMDPCVVLRVIVGAKGDPPVANAFDGAEGVEVALGDLG
jgi:hypothetical protein